MDNKRYYKDLYDLNYDLINTIGLVIDPMTKNLMDSDSRIQLKFNEKPIQASINPNNPVYPTEYNYVLDPINGDARLMLMLWQYHLSKEEVVMGRVALTTVEPIVDTKSYIQVKYTDGEIVTSAPYWQKSLKYADIILRVDNTIGELSVRHIDDLTNFDRPFDMIN